MHEVSAWEWSTVVNISSWTFCPHNWSIVCSWFCLCNTTSLLPCCQFDPLPIYGNYKYCDCLRLAQVLLSAVSTPDMPIGLPWYLGWKCTLLASFPGLSPRLLSLAVWKVPAFHTASDKSLGDKPGNEAIYIWACHILMVYIWDEIACFCLNIHVHPFWNYKHQLVFDVNLHL